jgi:hypothetical protein
MEESADDFMSPETARKRKIGRPKGTKNHVAFSTEQLQTRSQQLHAKYAAKREVWVDETMSSMGVSSRTRLSLSSPLLFNTPHLEPPKRIGRLLSDELIAIALRTICFLMKAKDESYTIFVQRNILILVIPNFAISRCCQRCGFTPIF